MLPSEGPLEFQDLVIDVQAWEVLRNGAPVSLTKTEFLILVALASRPRRVVTADELTAQVWGDTWFGDDGNIAVHVSKLRHKLGESGLAPRYIRTIRGVGYRFDPAPARHTLESQGGGESPTGLKAGHGWAERLA